MIIDAVNGPHHHRRRIKYIFFPQTRTQRALYVVYLKSSLCERYTTSCYVSFSDARRDYLSLSLSLSRVCVCIYASVPQILNDAREGERYASCFFYVRFFLVSFCMPFSFSFRPKKYEREDDLEAKKFLSKGDALFFSLARSLLALLS